MAAQQIMFFEKNKADISNTGVTLTASQGNDFIEYVRNRSNKSAWMTSDSVDSDNTTIEIDFVDERTITDIILVKHNFKSYTIQYWDGAAYQDFSTAIAETTNTAVTTHHVFNSVSTLKILLTITGTMTPDEDKYLYQFIVTENIGQLQGWPVIKKPMHNKNRKNLKMLSGKSKIIQNVGAFECQLSVEIWKIDADLTVIESIYEQPEGFLIWLCGGDEDQFSTIREGYRLEDIYLMKCDNEYTPQYYKGLYKSGLQIEIQMKEITE